MIVDDVMLTLLFFAFLLCPLAYQGPVLELYFSQVYFHIWRDEPGGFE